MVFAAGDLSLSFAEVSATLSPPQPDDVSFLYMSICHGVFLTR
jgi:hypothetical protein